MASKLEKVTKTLEVLVIECEEFLSQADKDGSIEYANLVRALEDAEKILKEVKLWK